MLVTFNEITINIKRNDEWGAKHNKNERSKITVPGIIASGLVSSRGIQKDLKKLEEKEGNQYVKLKAIENHRNYKFSTEVSTKLISIICNNSIAN